MRAHIASPSDRRAARPHGLPLLLLTAAGARGPPCTAAAKPDGSVVDGGRTVVHGGRWAAHVAAVLAAGGVRCRVEADWGAFQDAAAAKLVWSCIFWVLSAALGSATVRMARE